MNDMDKDERATMTVDEVKTALGVSEAWIYRLIRAGRLTPVSTGRRGRGSHTTILARDVERERLKRIGELEREIEADQAALGALRAWRGGE